MAVGERSEGFGRSEEVQLTRHPVVSRAVRMFVHSSKPILVASAAALLMVAMSASTGSAGNGTVRTQGGEQFVPNAKIQSTLKFTPGRITINSGETLTLEKSDSTAEPHTLSIVNKDEVPADIDAVFGCGEPGTVCDDVFSAFGGEPSGPTFVDAAGTGTGIDGRLDSLFVAAPGDSISAPVTAPSGSTLYFICAIHAWMQGEIDVK